MNKTLSFDFQGAIYCCLEGNNVIECKQYDENNINSVRSFDFIVKNKIKDQVDLKIQVYRYIANKNITKIILDLKRLNLSNEEIHLLVKELIEESTIKEDIIISNYKSVKVNNNKITIYSINDMSYSYNICNFKI